MMQEPAHRPLSFRANSFARFAKKYGITVEATPFDPYGLVENSTLKESKDFLINLSKDGRILNSTLTFEKYLTELPSVEDVLEHLANDAAIMEHFTRDPKRFAKLTGLPLARAVQVIEQASEVAGPFKILIGPEAYAEFVKISEMRG